MVKREVAQILPEYASLWSDEVDAVHANVPEEVEGQPFAEHAHLAVAEHPEAEAIGSEFVERFTEGCHGPRADSEDLDTLVGETTGNRVEVSQLLDTVQSTKALV